MIPVPYIRLFKLEKEFKEASVALFCKQMLPLIDIWQRAVGAEREEDSDEDCSSSSCGVDMCLNCILRVWSEASEKKFFRPSHYCFYITAEE